jgi:tetratricopeptide (TPR) repeat protein
VTLAWANFLQEAARSGQSKRSGKGEYTMSSYILCQTKKADVPYFIENISTNIYTIEELCYYLYHNLYLLDQTIFSEELCNWIGEELNLPNLAGKLRPRMGKFAAAEDILYPIFKEINYLTYDELKELNNRLVLLNEEPLEVREKKKGDALMENEMYVHAISVYQKLLAKEGLEEIREGFTAAIYHNLGCAYSYLFQMEKALECFRDAYHISHKPFDLRSYLLAFHRIHSEKEYETLVQELKVEDDMLLDIQDALNRFEKKTIPEVETSQVDGMLRKLTENYHRSTGS